MQEKMCRLSFKKNQLFLGPLANLDFQVYDARNQVHTEWLSKGVQMSFETIMDWIDSVVLPEVKFEIQEKFVQSRFCCEENNWN